MTEQRCGRYSVHYVVSNSVQTRGLSARVSAWAACPTCCVSISASPTTTSERAMRDRAVRQRGRRAGVRLAHDICAEYAAHGVRRSAGGAPLGGVRRAPVLRRILRDGGPPRLRGAHGQARPGRDGRGVHVPQRDALGHRGLPRLQGLVGLAEELRFL